MKKTLAIATILALTAFGFSDQAIWSGKLVNGWQDWSWAKVNKTGKTIKAVAKDWQGVYFHHDPQASTYASFSFAVNGGKRGGQRLQVRATVNKQPLKEAFLPALKPGWHTVTVKLKSLGLTGQSFDGVWIQIQKAGSFEIKGVKLKSK